MARVRGWIKVEQIKGDIDEPKIKERQERIVADLQAIMDNREAWKAACEAERGSWGFPLAMFFFGAVAGTIFWLYVFSGHYH